MERDPDRFEWALLRAIDDHLLTEQMHDDLVERGLTTHDNKTKDAPKWCKVKKTACDYYSLDRKTLINVLLRRNLPTDEDTRWTSARKELERQNLIKSKRIEPPERDFLLLTPRGDRYIADVLRTRGPLGIAEDRQNKRMFWIAVAAIIASFVLAVLARMYGN